MSERKPSSARNGATSTGIAIIAATTIAGTLSSTIITRFSVPSSITLAMPDRDLEQRQPQQLAQRQPVRRRVGEGQHPQRQALQSATA